MDAARCLRAGLSVFALSVGLLWTSAGFATAIYSANSPEEYQRKVEFILNFCRLTESPSKPFQTPNDNFILGILGEDPIEPYLEALASEKCVGHSFELARFTMDDDFTRAQILVIGNSVKDRLDTVLEQLAGKTVLTIGDFEGFANRGGMYEFSYQDIPISERENARKVRFRMNVGAIEAAGMRPSITLSKIGDVVETDTDAGTKTGDRIRIAVLPPWEKHISNQVRGIKDGFFLSLSSHPSFRITHAEDKNLWGNDANVQRLEISESDRARIWKQVGRTQNSEPDIDVVKELVNALDVRAVFMYSSPAGSDIESTFRRAYLVDIESGKVHLVEKGLNFEAGGNYAWQTKEMVDGLLNKYLDDLADPRIRVAILPGHNRSLSFRKITSEDIFISLADNEDVIVTQVAEPELAKALGASRIDVNPSQVKKMWPNATNHQFAKLDVGVVNDLVKDLNVDIALSYSYPKQNTSPHFILMYIADLHTGEILQAKLTIPGITSHNYSKFFQFEIGKLIGDFANNRPTSHASTSEPASQMTYWEASTTSPQ